MLLNRAADHDIDPFTDSHQAGVFFVERSRTGLQLRGNLAGLFAVIGVDEGSAFNGQREARLYGPIEHRIRGAVLKIGEQDGDCFVSFWRSWPRASPPERPCHRANHQRDRYGRHPFPRSGLGWRHDDRGD